MLTPQTQPAIHRRHDVPGPPRINQSANTRSRSSDSASKSLHHISSCVLTQEGTISPLAVRGTVRTHRSLHLWETSPPPTPPPPLRGFILALATESDCESPALMQTSNQGCFHGRVYTRLRGTKLPSGQTVGAGTRIRRPARAPMNIDIILSVSTSLSLSFFSSSSTFLLIWLHRIQVRKPLVPAPFF